MSNFYKKKNLVMLWIASLILVSGVAFAQHNHDHGAAPASNVQELQLMNELQGKNGRQAMELANSWRKKNIDVVTFVTPVAVHFQFKNGKTVSVPLPDDEMVVSIAPYIHKTHECSTHYMSKCDGELKNTWVKVKAVAATGKILIDKKIKIPPTGFFDLWLPRNQKIDISVSAAGKKAKGKILTFRDSKTCDTTLKLE